MQNSGKIKITLCAGQVSPLLFIVFLYYLFLATLIRYTEIRFHGVCLSLRLHAEQMFRDQVDQRDVHWVVG